MIGEDQDEACIERMYMRLVQPVMGIEQRLIKIITIFEIWGQNQIGNGLILSHAGV